MTARQIFLSIMFLFCSYTSAHAATTTVVVGGELVGFDNVVVGSDTYNVRFIVGSYNSIFGDPSGLDFTTAYDAGLAAQALLGAFDLFPTYDDDPGLTILPTHREMHSYTARTTDQILAEAAESFDVTPMTDRQALEAALAGATETDRRIGFYDGAYYLLRLKGPEVMSKHLPDRVPEWRMLDVSILHELLIERIMGISKEKVAAKENIDYHRDLDLALSNVDQGKAQCVFIMNPTRMAEVKACSDKGAKMPQKSTDFYPKVVTGLVAMAVGAKERF